MIWNLSLYINLLVLAVGLATWAKLNVILKIGLRNISKRITRFIILNIYTPPQHVLTHIILSFKIIDNANSKFNLKIKEYLQLIRQNLKRTTKSFSCYTLTIAYASLLFLFVFVFFFHSFSSIVFIICDTNYWHLLLY